jgi:formylglycine-generating enzyme required for sulfatase activity
MSGPLQQNPSTSYPALGTARSRFVAAWQAGRAPRLEEVLAQALPADRAAWLGELLAVEVNARKERGERPAPAEYLARFPELADVVEQAFRPEGEPASQQTLGPDASQEAGTLSAPPVPAASASPLRAGGMLGVYELLEKLGEGGMGAVWKARHTRLDKLVAVKVLPPRWTDSAAALSRFQREMRAVGKLEHAHIVRAMDAGDVNGTHYLVMEYVEGTDLGKLVKERGRCKVDSACEMVCQAALGLAHAHKAGLVHRDVKPSNLFLSKQGTVKLLDLGLARLHDESAAADSEALTAQGQVLGTPDYMAPEQWGDTHAAGAPADLYALGCTLFYLLIGRAPYADARHSAPANKMHGHVMEAAPDLRALRPDVPEAVDALYRRLMAKEPKERFASADELALELKTVIKSLQKANAAEPESATAPVVTPPVAQATASSAPLRKRRRVGVLLGLGGAAAALLAGVIVLIITNRDGSKTKIEVPADATVEVKKDGKTVAKVAPDEKVKEKEKPREQPVAEVVNSIGMKLVRIPAGKFTMGSTKQEQDEAIADYEKRTGKKLSDDLLYWWRAEGPRHEVEISRPFYLGVTEVTQKQYKAVMGYNPSVFSANGEGRPGVTYTTWKPGQLKDKVKGLATDDFPVENLSYEEAVELCRKLSELPAEKGAGRTYRLPTEAEWEYSSRGGASSPYPFGSTITDRHANFNYHLQRTCAVGSYPANAFGLFGMQGNVREWCSDWYDPDYYARSPRRDPQGPEKGTQRVFRGGSWSIIRSFCRSASRDKIEPESRKDDLGFRVALIPAGR